MEDIWVKLNLMEQVKEWFVESLGWLLEGVVLTSSNICLIVGMVGIILYIFGWKKCKNLPYISLAIHILIQLIGGVLLGV